MYLTSSFYADAAEKLILSYSGLSEKEESEKKRSLVVKCKPPPANCRRTRRDEGFSGGTRLLLRLTASAMLLVEWVCCAARMSMTLAAVCFGALGGATATPPMNLHFPNSISFPPSERESEWCCFSRRCSEEGRKFM